MDDLIGKIVVAVVTVVAAAVVRKIESGLLKNMLRATIVGLEQGTKDMPAEEAKAIKSNVQAAAESTGVQKQLHALVKQITEEKSGAKP